MPLKYTTLTLVISLLLDLILLLLQFYEYYWIIKFWIYKWCFRNLFLKSHCYIFVLQQIPIVLTDAILYFLQRCIKQPLLNYLFLTKTYIRIVFFQKCHGNILHNIANLFWYIFNLLPWLIFVIPVNGNLSKFHFLESCALSSSSTRQLDLVIFLTTHLVPKN